MSCQGTIRETFLQNNNDDTVNPAIQEKQEELINLVKQLFIEDSIIEYDSIDTVADDARVTILTYQNGTGGDIWLDGFMATGNADGEYTLWINGEEKVADRSSEQERTSKVFFPKPIKIVDGTIIDIKVIHWDTQFTGEFKATLFAHTTKS